VSVTAAGDGPASGSDGATSCRFSLDDSIGFLVYRAQLAMKAELGRRFTPHDVTPEQWAMLVRLWEEDGLSQKELAERTFKDQANTARIVQKLEGKGLVVRAVSPADRRSLSLHLTDAARALVPELVPRAQGVLDLALAGVSAHEAATARRVLCSIFSNMCGEPSTPTARAGPTGPA
jgi:DNA-binding MarR family transcriptional regulator